VHILISLAFVGLGMIIGAGLLMWIASRGKTEYDGVLEVTADAKDIFQLELNIEPEQMKEREDILIQVVKRPIS
jgi:hypothetical protein